MRRGFAEEFLFVPQFLKGIDFMDFTRNQLPPLHCFEKGQATPAQKKPVFQKSVAIHLVRGHML